MLETMLSGSPEDLILLESLSSKLELVARIIIPLLHKGNDVSKSNMLYLLTIIAFLARAQDSWPEPFLAFIELDGPDFLPLDSSNTPYREQQDLLISEILEAVRSMAHKEPLSRPPSPLNFMI